jgi:hypothetical protein
MRNIVTKEFGAEGVAKLTQLIDAYCEKQYPYGAPDKFEDLKTILTKLVTDPKYPGTPEEMDLILVDDNLEIYTIPYDGTLKIEITNEAMKTQFPEANIVASSEVGGVFTLSNGRESEKDPAYVGIDIEVFDEEQYENDTDET